MEAVPRCRDHAPRTILPHDVAESQNAGFDLDQLEPDPAKYRRGPYNATTTLRNINTMPPIGAHRFANRSRS